VAFLAVVVAFVVFDVVMVAPLFGSPTLTSVVTLHNSCKQGSALGPE